MNTKYLDELIEYLLMIDSKSEMENFLRGLLTEKELQELPQRVQIVKLLKKGKPQRQIAEELGIGVGTITRGSTEIKKGRFRSI